MISRPVSVKKVGVEVQASRLPSFFTANVAEQPLHWLIVLFIVTQLPERRVQVALPLVGRTMGMRKTLSRTIGLSMM